MIPLENYASIESLAMLSIATEKDGWWGEGFGANLKSAREGKIGNQTLQTLEASIEQALTWMKEDELVESIDVAASSINKSRVEVIVKLTLPSGGSTVLRLNPY